MKVLFLIISIFFISSPSWSETVTIDDLKEKNGFYYKKFSIFSPLNFLFGFTGIVESYYENGNLRVKGNFKYGKKMVLGYHIITMVSYGQKKITKMENQMVIWKNIHLVVS